LLRRIVQACFLIIGGTLGIVFIPDLLNMVNLNHNLINNPYVSAILGAIIFYFITFWAIDYMVNFIKLVEETLVKAPITDIITGSVGLAFGLILAFNRLCTNRHKSTVNQYGRAYTFNFTFWLFRLSGRIQKERRAIHSFCS
jgi:uncharacterized protein YacL